MLSRLKSFTQPSRIIHSYVYRMDTAYLRHCSDAEQFCISFKYSNAEQGVDRQFNFTRQLTEPVSTFLGRVAVNVEKVINKKNKKKKQTDALECVASLVQPVLLLNSIQVDQDVICKDVFESSNSVILQLLGRNYQVLINSPFVDVIGLPNSILADFPVHPAKFDATYTDINESDFIWYKSSDKKRWEEIGHGYLFTPSNETVGCYLKLSCTPKMGDLVGPVIETVSDVVVSASPGVCPFDNRHQFTRKQCEVGNFRVVTYNILADLYCDSNYTREVLHPYCPPYALTIEYRKQLVLKELLGYNADIICLQEVDRKVYRNDLCRTFEQLGYGSYFSRKGSSVAEGVACFYNKNKFRELKRTSIILSNHLQTDEVFADIWEHISINPALSERVLERQTVLQTTTLQCIENDNILIVANTHLYFHPDADHIRLLQGGMCIKYVEDVYQKCIAETNNKNVSVIFCGDFNSVPECGIYKLYTTGTVGADCIDWESNKAEAVKDLSITQPFKLKSACGTPKYTNYTVGFADCLDYIFYDARKLNVSQIIPLPSMKEITQHTALPSVVCPSDHISLAADLKWN